MVQKVLQSGATVITKPNNCYYKVGRVLLLQSGTILLQSGTGITKWEEHYKVGHLLQSLP